MSEKPQDEQLSGKVVCGHGLPVAQCGEHAPRPAQPQAPADDLREIVRRTRESIHAAAPSLDARAMLLEGALVRLLETQSVSFSDEQAAAIDYACDEVLRRRIEPKEGHRRSVDAPCSEGTPEPSDALRETWIKGCLAGREEGATVADSWADAPAASNAATLCVAASAGHIADQIRSLPAPTAPKEPQR